LPISFYAGLCRSMSVLGIMGLAGGEKEWTLLKRI
jgi:hypothetical protein